MSESFGSMALPVRDFLAEEHRRQSVDIRDATGSEHQVQRVHWYWYCHNFQSGESNKGISQPSEAVSSLRTSRRLLSLSIRRI